MGRRAMDGRPHAVGAVHPERRLLPAEAEAPTFQSLILNLSLDFQAAYSPERRPQRPEVVEASSNLMCGGRATESTARCRARPANLSAGALVTNTRDD